MQKKNQKFIKNILIELAKYLNVKGIQGVANYFGENRSRMYAWVKNGKIPDTGIILAKHPEISIEWLRTGEGPMLITPRKPVKLPKARTKTFPAIEDIPVKSSMAVAEGDFSISEMLTMAAVVLDSKTVYRDKLASSIKTFHEAVQGGNVVGMREEMAMMKTEMQELKQLLLSLGAVLPEKKEMVANS